MFLGFFGPELCDFSGDSCKVRNCSELGSVYETIAVHSWARRARVLRGMFMSKLLFLIGKIFSWFILLSSRSNSFLEQATNLFLLDPASVNPETENSDFQFSLVDLSNFKAISHIFYFNLLPSDPSITKF